MRELAKSMISYAWANSLFGVQQALNLIKPTQSDQEHPATAAFDAVSAAATSQLNPSMKAAFDSAEGFQENMVNMMFEVMDPSRWRSVGTRIMDQAAKGARSAAQASADAPRQGATTTMNAASGATQGATTGFGPMPS